MNISKHKTISKRNRVLIAIASILLLAVFLFPLWQIRMQAPQYPEELGLNIWVNTIKSLHPHNIQSINDLNHYIGMKPIDPHSVPALKFLPYIMVGLCLLGLSAAIFAKRFLLTTWIVAALGAAVGGLIDFHKWEYNYGHHLNPHAAIKIPGMSYQPPLIGSKQLLNIHAMSYPHIGVIAVGVSIIIGIYVWINEYVQRNDKIRDLKSAQRIG